MDYSIPTSASESKLTIKGSKFIGSCVPVEDESGALKTIEVRSKKNHTASHNCWAFRTGDPLQNLERYSDAGEPSGTAGRPIFDQIRKAGLFGVVLIVSRWFGGTKLGRGGLIRAYGECAELALQQVKTKVVFPESLIEVDCDYTFVGSLEHSVGLFSGKITGSRFDTAAHFTIRLRTEFIDEFNNKIREDSSGRIVAKIKKPGS